VDSLTVYSPEIYRLAMKTIFGIFLFIILQTTNILGQSKTFEIFGKINGEYKSQIYLFFENQFSKKDSISAFINDGNFYLKERAVLPILCRIHFGEKTNIQDIYIDNEKTFLSLSSKLSEKNTPDSLGGARTHFEIDSVSGSQNQNIIVAYQIWKKQSQEINESNGQKASNYFAELQSLAIKYPSNKATAYLIAGRGFLMGSRYMLMEDFPLKYSQVNELKNLLSESLKSAYEWNNLNGFLNSLEKEDKKVINTPFYNVILKDIKGEQINTNHFSNKFQLIDFWASWCKPCRALNPELKTLYGKYKNKNFEIIGVSLDEDKKAWEKAILQDNLKWTQLNDEKSFEGQLAKYYNIGTRPQNILVDDKNQIIGINLSIKEIEVILKQKLAN
jgi:thiol-disulfide isomerase/thioredoxin